MPAAGDRLALTWAPREVPLEVRAVAATGAAATALGAKLAALDDAALAELAAVAGAGVLVAIGRDLPWCDGVVYLGSEPAAPSLLLPTALAPSVPAPLLARAVGARLGATEPGTVAVLPAPLRLVAVDAARAIDRARLAAWLAAEAPA